MPTSKARSRSGRSQLARSVSELEALGEVSRAISSTLDLRAVLDSHPGPCLPARRLRRRRDLRVRPGAPRSLTWRPVHGMGEDLIAARARACRSVGRRRGRPVRRAPRGGADRRIWPRRRPTRCSSCTCRPACARCWPCRCCISRRLIGALVVRRKRVGAFAERYGQPAAIVRGAVGRRHPERAAVQRDRAEVAASWRRRAGTSPSSSPT